jgi:GNAT superfamily N-acetyltransferase
MFHAELVDSLEPDAKSMIESVLAAHNKEYNSEFWIARELFTNAPRPLNICVRTDEGRDIGGLVGETQFRWLKVMLMSVDSSWRRRGLGTEMMKLAEAEAVVRKCRYAFVDTMDYQAPAFYKHIGYTIVGRIDDWDSHGHAKLFLTKQIA